MKYEIIIKEHHLDTFGHVNNAVYLQMYEEARWELITRGGYGLREVRENLQGPVILEANLKFIRELKLREKITVSYELLDYTGKIGRLKQIMTKENGEVASELIMTMGFFDLKTRKLIEPTPAWRKAIGLDS